MTTPPVKKRTCVMIVETEIPFGITLADCLASHGYQPILVRSVEAALEAFEDVRPDTVVLGLPKIESPETVSLLALRRMISLVAPRIPVITMGTAIRLKFGQHQRKGRTIHRPYTPPVRRWNRPKNFDREQASAAL